MSKKKKIKKTVKKLREVEDQLGGAVVAHGNQQRIVGDTADALEDGTMTAKIKRTKISPACKAAAKRKFKVWPSAYASGWGVRCTRNPGKYLGRKKK